MLHLRYRRELLAPWIRARIAAQVALEKDLHVVAVQQVDQGLDPSRIGLVMLLAVAGRANHSPVDLGDQFVPALTAHLAADDVERQRLERDPFDAGIAADQRLDSGMKPAALLMQAERLAHHFGRRRADPYPAVDREVEAV